MRTIEQITSGYWGANGHWYPSEDLARETYVQAYCWKVPGEGQVQPPPATPAAKAALAVFISHSRFDTECAKCLYDSLLNAGIRPWLALRDIVGGQDWELEIEKAISAANAIIICLSKAAVAEPGYFHVELTRALKAAARQPDGAIYLIPLRLDECQVPDRLTGRQWIDYFRIDGHDELIRALQARAGMLDLPMPTRGQRA